MARARTLQALREQARAYADAVESRNTTDAQANVWINQSLALLWGKLTTLDPLRFKVTTVLTPNGSLEYDFADGSVFAPTAEDFMSIVGVDRMGSGGRYPLEPYTFNDRGTSSIRGAGVLSPYEPGVRYAIHGQGIDGEATRLVFDRAPHSGTYEVHYIQAPPTLASDIATFDGVAGFEEWAILRTAILMAQREESDASVLMALMRDAETDIRTLGAARDSGRAAVPAKVFGRHNRGLRGWPCG